MFSLVLLFKYSSFSLFFFFLNTYMYLVNYSDALLVHLQAISTFLTEILCKNAMYFGKECWNDLYL